MGRLKINKKNWTEEQIQEILSYNFMSPSSVKYICENLFIFKEWESDLILITKSNYIYEFEIKVSKADFKNDFKHKAKKHTILKENKEDIKKPNYFYYVVPENLIAEEDIPEYAGLIYMTDIFPKFKVVKTAPKLDENKYNETDLDLVKKFYYNYRDNKDKVKKKNKELVLIKERLDESINVPEDKHKSYYDIEEENKRLKAQLKHQEQEYKTMEERYVSRVNSLSNRNSILHQQINDLEKRLIK